MIRRCIIFTFFLLSSFTTAFKNPSLISLQHYLGSLQRCENAIDTIFQNVRNDTDLLHSVSVIEGFEEIINFQSIIKETIMRIRLEITYYDQTLYMSFTEKGDFYMQKSIEIINGVNLPENFDETDNRPNGKFKSS